MTGGKTSTPKKDHEIFQALYHMKVDPKGGITKLEKSARSGSVESMLNLAAVYSSGKFVSKDIKKAQEWYDRAYIADPKQSAYFFGRFCFAQHDIVRAEEIFSRGVSLGDTSCKMWLAHLYLSYYPEKKRQGLTLLRDAVHEGNFRAKLYWGKLLRDGKLDGQPKNTFKGALIAVSALIQMIFATIRNPRDVRMR